MKKIRIGTSVICEALKGAYNRFYPITTDMIENYHLEKFQADFLDFVSRCVCYASNFTIVKYQRLGPVETFLDVMDNDIHCKVHFKCVQYGDANGLPDCSDGDKFRIGMIEMDECPYIDYDDCYKYFKKTLRRNLRES